MLSLHEPSGRPSFIQADANRIHEVLKRCAKLANTCLGQSLTNLGLFLDILESYLFFVKQKSIIDDPDDAIGQIVEVIEGKIQEVGDNECKQHLDECRARWM